MNNNIRNDKRDIDYHLYLSNNDINIALAIMIGTITAFLTVMLKAITGDASDNSPIFIIYFNIVVVLVSIYSMKIYGILVAGISACLFCLTLEKFIITEAVIKNMAWNVFVNIIQAVIIWTVFSFKKLRDIGDFCFIRKDENLTNDRFRILLSITGIFYVIIGINLFINKEEKYLNIFIFAFILAVAMLYLVESILNKVKNHFTKSIYDFKYLFFVCIIPSGIGALINSFFPTFFGSGWIHNYLLWAGSNFILLSTFGYVILCFISNKKETDKQETNDLHLVKVPVLLYYTAIILWNILFFIMYSIGWLDGNNNYTITYIFPWLIGNLLFISNFVMSTNDEFDVNSFTEENNRNSLSVFKNKSFKWFEDRAIVAEKNTAIIMQIVALAIPVIMTLTSNNNGLSPNIIIIFVLNISTTTASVALVWVPQGNIKFMSLIKTLKTILHLFSISLLLLNLIMFINEFIK